MAQKIKLFPGEESLDASTSSGAQPIPNKKQKGNKSDADVLDEKRRELSKQDIKPTVFHSDHRIVVCLQNPYQKVSFSCSYKITESLKIIF